MEAFHDKGQLGIPDKMKKYVISELSKYSKVYISSEDSLPKELNKYKLNIRPKDIHIVLKNADLFFGESGTMAVESALLGTPSVRVSSLAKSLGNFNELNEKYKLLYYYEDTNEALNKSISILKNKDSRDIWKKRKIF